MVTDRQLDTRKLRNLTGVAVLMGVAWLLIERALRGGDGQVELLTPLAIAIGVAGFFWGLALRARVSMRGELAVNSELTWIVFLAISLLPATMLVVYAIVSLLSLGVVGLLWILFGIGFLLTWIMQIALWAGVLAVGAFVADKGDENKAVLVGISVATYIGVVSLAGMWIGGTLTSAWNCSLPYWFSEFRNRIPGWMFIFESLRSVLAGLHHNRLISVLLSIACGMVGALLCALAVRWMRHRLMGRPTWRPYLPLAAAPIPDEVPMLDPKMLLPVITYVFCTWAVIMSVVVL